MCRQIREMYNPIGDVPAGKHLIRLMLCRPVGEIPELTGGVTADQRKV